MLGLGDLFVRVRPNSDGFSRELGQQLRGVGQDLGLGDVLGAAAFTAGVAKITTGAAQLEQAVGGNEAVFKGAADQMQRFAEGAAESAGLSERAALTLSTRLGGALKAVGFSIDEAADKSQYLVQTGADLAALYGGTTQEAVEAFSSALRGEYDPLERYVAGISDATVRAKALELGLAGSTEEVDSNAKAQALLALVTERSADAQGQFARESESAAGQASIAAAQAQNAADDLGTNFLPIYTKITEVVGAVAGAFGALPGPVQTGLVALLGVVALKGPLSSLSDAAKDFAKNLGGGLSGMQQAGLLAGAAATAFALWQYQMQRAEQEVGALTDKVRGSFADQGVTADDFRAKLAEVQAEIEGLRQEGDRSPLRFWDADYTYTIDKGRESLEQLAGEYQRIADEQAPALAAAMGITNDEALAFLATQAAQSKVYGDNQSAIDAYRASQEQAKGATKSASEAAKQQAEDLDKLQDAFLGVIDGQAAVEESQQRIVDATQRVSDAQQGYVDAQQRVRDAEYQREGSLRTLEEAQRRVTEAQEALTSALSGADRERADIAVERARLRLADAEQRLADGDFDDVRDRQDAELDVRQARLDLLDAEERASTLAADATDQLRTAEQAVAEAQRGAAAAARGVADAQRGVTAAARDLTDAQRNVVAAQGDAARASIALQERQAALRDTVAGGAGNVGLLRQNLVDLAASSPNIAAGLQPLIAALEVLERLTAPAGGGATIQHGGAGDIYSAYEAVINDPNTPPEIRDRILNGAPAEGQAEQGATGTAAEGNGGTTVNVNMTVNGPTARQFADDTMREVSFALSTLAG